MYVTCLAIMRQNVCDLFGEYTSTCMLTMPGSAVLAAPWFLPQPAHLVCAKLRGKPCSRAGSEPLLGLVVTGAPCAYNTTCRASRPDNTVGKCSSDDLLPSGGDCSAIGDLCNACKPNDGHIPSMCMIALNIRHDHHSYVIAVWYSRGFDHNKMYRCLGKDKLLHKRL